MEPNARKAIITGMIRCIVSPLLLGWNWFTLRRGHGRRGRQKWRSRYVIQRRDHQIDSFVNEVLLVLPYQALHERGRQLGSVLVPDRDHLAIRKLLYLRDPE